MGDGLRALLALGALVLALCVLVTRRLQRTAPIRHDDRTGSEQRDDSALRSPR